MWPGQTPFCALAGLSANPRHPLLSQGIGSKEFHLTQYSSCHTHRQTEHQTLPTRVMVSLGSKLSLQSPSDL